MTLLATLYPKIRYEVLRKNDSAVLPDADLELAVNQILEFELTNYSIQDDSGQKVISPELTPADHRLLILKTTLSLLLPEDSFSYRTAALTKTLEGQPGLERQIADLKDRILDVETNGQGRIYSDNEFGQYLNEATRLENTLTQALAEG